MPLKLKVHHTNTILNANQLDNEMTAGQSIKW